MIINGSGKHASVGIAAFTFAETSLQGTSGLLYDALSNSVYKAPIDSMTGE
jgi:hypothetical protein